MNFKIGFPTIKLTDVLIVCSGPSAKDVDWSSLHNLKATIISVNYSINHIPRANIWFTCDFRKAGTVGKEMADTFVIGFKQRHLDKLVANKLKYPNLPEDRTWFVPLKQESPGFVLDGENLSCLDSGFLSINLAVQLGAERIALVGYDCTHNEWFHAHPYQSHCPPRGTPQGKNSWLKIAANQTSEAGVEIVNGSLRSTCDVWPRRSPMDAIKWISK